MTEETVERIRRYIELLQKANIVINAKTEFEFRTAKGQVRVETIGFELEQSCHECEA